MHFEITQEHINAGIPSEPWSCPVCLAIAEQAGLWDVAVTDNYVHIADTEYLLPQVVSEFIQAFDNGGYVEPIEFELEIPNAY